jgi:hypothetical protein
MQVFRRLRIPNPAQGRPPSIRPQSGDDYPGSGLSELAGRMGSNTCSQYSSTWSDRFRLMESLLVRVIDMHAAAVSPKQVKLGTHRAALRMWIPENDG